MAYVPYQEIGTGVVTENKPLGTNTILVSPKEMLPGLVGDAASENQRITYKGQGADGTPFDTVAYTNNSREAYWLPDDTFRLTSPDLRRGDIVRLFRYGDSPDWYWKELGNGKLKRRGETIVLGASGYLDLPDPNVSGEELAIDYHYRIEMSGHRKMINIVTANKNGEDVLLHLLLDSKNKKISLGDDQGQEFVLSTDDKRLSFRNSEGTYAILDKKNMYLGSDDNIFIQSEKTIGIKTKSLVFQADNLLLDISNSITSKAAIWNHTGPFHLKGDFTLEGRGIGQGGGGFVLDGDVIANGISLINHIHRANGEYALVSKPE